MKAKKITPVNIDKAKDNQKATGWIYARNIYMMGDTGEPVKDTVIKDAKTFKLFKELGYIKQK